MRLFFLLLSVIQPLGYITLYTLLDISFAISRNKLCTGNVLIQFNVAVAYALCIFVCNLWHYVTWTVHEVVLDEPLANKLLGELLLSLTLLELLLLALGIEVA